MDFAYVTLSSHNADRLSRFYCELTEQPVTMDEGAYLVLGEGPAPRLAFQRIAPGQSLVPAHVDLRVADLAAATARVEAGGGRVGGGVKEGGAPGGAAVDPGGNGFCLMGPAPP